MALASAEPRRAEALLERLVDAICGAVDSRLGLDAQAGNWAVEEDGLALFDVSPPLMRAPDGSDVLDMALFASVYPAVLRPALRRLDRAWQRRLRRRPYRFLPAPPYRYGPMTPPGKDPS